MRVVTKFARTSSTGSPEKQKNISHMVAPVARRYGEQINVNERVTRRCLASWSRGVLSCDLPDSTISEQRIHHIFSRLVFRVSSAVLPERTLKN